MVSQSARLRGQKSGADSPQTTRPTRTYTGEALARRQAWGKKWGAIQKSIGQQIREMK